MLVALVEDVVLETEEVEVAAVDDDDRAVLDELELPLRTAYSGVFGVLKEYKLTAPIRATATRAVIR